MKVKNMYTCRTKTSSMFKVSKVADVSENALQFPLKTSHPTPPQTSQRVPRHSPRTVKHPPSTPTTLHPLHPLLFTVFVLFFYFFYFLFVSPSLHLTCSRCSPRPVSALPQPLCDPSRWSETRWRTQEGCLAIVNAVHRLIDGAARSPVCA